VAGSPPFPYLRPVNLCRASAPAGQREESRSEEKRLINERVEAYRQNPDAIVSWTLAKADIRKQIGL
jgi:hypothetical protein